MESDWQHRVGWNPRLMLMVVSLPCQTMILSSTIVLHTGNEELRKPANLPINLLTALLSKQFCKWPRPMRNWQRWLLKPR